MVVLCRVVANRTGTEACPYGLLTPPTGRIVDFFNRPARMISRSRAVSPRAISGYIRRCSCAPKPAAGTEFPLLAYIDRIDRHISGWMNRYGRLFLRISLAVVFIWFGALKPLGMSAAAELVRRTVYWLPPDFFIPLLGWWEVAIGVGLLFRPLIRVALFLLFLQMPGTVLPLFLLPEVCFTQIPFAPTLEGQYIIKNLILLSAAIAVGGTVRREESTETRT